MCAQTISASPDDSLTLAKTKIKSHQIGQAEIILRDHLAANPSSTETMYLLGRVLQTENKPKESLEFFNEAAAIARPSGEDLRIVALDYVLLGDYVSSARWLNRSLEIDPENSETWYDLARTKMMQSDYSGALGPIEKALTLRPKMVKAENNLGLILEAQNRPVEAAEAYRLAVEWQKAEAHPSEQPLLNYGTLLIDQQRSAEAVPFLEQAVGIAPTNVKCHEQLARALDRQGNAKRAIEEMQAAILLDKSNPRLHFQLGQIYRRAGEPEKGREEMLLSQKLYGSKSSEPTPQ